MPEPIDVAALRAIASKRRAPGTSEELTLATFGGGLPTDAAVLAAEMLKLDERLVQIEGSA